MTQRSQSRRNGFLHGVRVLELADERGEFCGKLLAGAGADVVKVEPPEGSPARRIGPYYKDTVDPEASLHFWHYNFGKRGITLDVASPQGQQLLKDLVPTSDVLLETHPPGYLDSCGLGYANLKAINPRLIMASITPFGQTGPYRHWRGSDLVHLAMGGMMMLTGYDPEADGRYETPPIAPQMWHSSHMVGAHTFIAILAALLFREKSGDGQYLDASIHRAVNSMSGSDVAYWVYNRLAFLRQTARQANAQPLPEVLTPTSDDRYLLTYLFQPQHYRNAVQLLAEHGAAGDLADPKYQDVAQVMQPDTQPHVHAAIRRWIAQIPYGRETWREAQRHGLHWAPVRRPEENLADPHWRERATFTEVLHQDIRRTFTYLGAPWLAAECPWRTGPRAPRLSEHTQEVLKERSTGNRKRRAIREIGEPLPPATRLDGSEPPFPIEGVRIVDLAWVIAGAGGPSLLATLGAEDIRIEWKGHFDNIRMGAPVIPIGRERDRVLAGESLRPTLFGPNQGGGFADVNRGKRGISLNLRKPKGRALLMELVRVSDIVVENFTAGTMESWGLGYEEMRRINPSIIYVQQPGFGSKGRYARVVSSAPVAEAFTGITEQSGLPAPHPPAGWGNFYLDWSAASCCAMAILSALYHRARTGKGQYIDSSLAEYGLYMTGTAILDYQANHRSWQRTGNRSPYKPAAPHGAYRCLGPDRWIAIATFSEDDWRALSRVLDDPAWTKEGRFATLASRISHQDELDPLVEGCTRTWDPFELMERLQGVGVAAGVCQTAEDRVTRDPQLQHDRWMVPLANMEVGVWPARDFPVKLSESPARVGGLLKRAFPCYGEDNDHVYGTVLGLRDGERRQLREEEVI